MRAALVASVTAFALLALWVCSGASIGFDLAVRGFVHGYASDPLTALMKLLTTVGTDYVWGPLVLGIAFVLWRKQRGRDAVWLVGLAVSAYALNEGLKHIFLRQRPYPFFGLRPLHSYSFPSGHAMIATTVYMAIAWLLTRKKSRRPSLPEILFGCLSFSIGLSRVYLGDHYPSDVIGGFLGAAACLSGAALVRDPDA